jgi:uncharacterized protein YkwD
MKTKLQRLLVPIILVLTLVSCSKDETADTKEIEETNYNYSTDETTLANKINEYRVSVGKNPLIIINHISNKSLEHNEYMITNNVVNHDYFDDRANNLIHVLGAVRVGENIAYNFSTPNSAMNAWINSPGHKANLDGDYTHFGVSISINPANGKKYYTNIFMKK